MYRSTTPTVILHVKNEDFDMNQIEVCHVAIESENGRIRKVYENPDINVEEKTITFTMTQDDTLNFMVGKIKLQTKMKLIGGAVVASKMIVTQMNEILEEEVL